MGHCIATFYMLHSVVTLCIFTLYMQYMQHYNVTLYIVTMNFIITVLIPKGVHMLILLTV